MRTREFALSTLGAAIAGALVLTATLFAQQRGALAVDTARITIDGSSNVHAWSAATTTARVTRVQIAESAPGPGFWDAIVKPGGLTAFEIAIPVATLHSAKDGLDKNMYKALNASTHPEITFRLLRVEGGTAGALRAAGVLTINGVEKDVAFNLKTERRESTLAVRGALELLMTDFGIAPPKAMMGMIKADPKVTVTIETVLSVPLT
jgi:hypothetical protein